MAKALEPHSVSIAQERRGAPVIVLRILTLPRKHQNRALNLMQDAPWTSPHGFAEQLQSEHLTVGLKHLAPEPGREGGRFGLFQALDEVTEPMFADQRSSPVDVRALLGFQVIASSDCTGGNQRCHPLRPSGSQRIADGTARGVTPEGSSFDM